MVLLSVCCSSAADATAKDTAAKERPKRARGRLLRTRRGAVVVVDSPMVPSIMARLVGRNRKQKMAGASETECFMRVLEEDKYELINPPLFLGNSLVHFFIIIRTKVHMKVLQ